MSNRPSFPTRIRPGVFNAEPMNRVTQEGRRPLGESLCGAGVELGKPRDQLCRPPIFPSARALDNCQSNSVVDPVCDLLHAQLHPFVEQQL